jgi:Putative prokaryotic signal transducing protein
MGWKMTELFADSDKFVTVGKFLEPSNAQMAKGALESAGIECFLQGENANSLLALAFRARLLVHKQDEEAAREILGGAGDELTAAEIADDEE